MRLTEKIRKAFTAEGLLSARRGLQRAIHPQPVSKFLRHVDPGVMDAMRFKHAPLMQPARTGPSTSTPNAGSSSTSAAPRTSASTANPASCACSISAAARAGSCSFASTSGHDGGRHRRAATRRFTARFSRQARVAAASSRPSRRRSPCPRSCWPAGNSIWSRRFPSSSTNTRRGACGRRRTGVICSTICCGRFLQPGARVYFDLNPNYDGQFMTPDMAGAFPTARRERGPAQQADVRSVEIDAVPGHARDHAGTAMLPRPLRRVISAAQRKSRDDEPRPPARATTNPKPCTSSGSTPANRAAGIISPITKP